MFGYIVVSGDPENEKRMTIGWSMKHLRHTIHELIYEKTIFTLSSTNHDNCLPLPNDVMISISKYLDCESIFNLSILNRKRCSNSLCGAMLYALIVEYGSKFKPYIRTPGHDFLSHHDIKLNKTALPSYVETQIRLFAIISGVISGKINLTISWDTRQLKNIIKSNYYIKFERSDEFARHIVQNMTPEMVLDIFEETNSYFHPFVKYIETRYLDTKNYIKYLIETTKRYTFTDFPLLLSILRCDKLFEMYQLDLKTYYSKDKLDTMLSMLPAIISCGHEHVFDNLSDKSRIFDGLYDDRIEPICRILKKKGYNRKILNAMCDLIIMTSYSEEHTAISTVMVKHDIIGTTKKEKDESIQYVKTRFRSKSSILR